ncbi:MAG: hypothetical protein RDV48_20265 [Candidatus Eremiobacteraeota bacterium]|nr:hypothetical protein [Candidatus Eremiobacteraeota bacterium]
MQRTREGALQQTTAGTLDPCISASSALSVMASAAGCLATMGLLIARAVTEAFAG